MSRRANNARRAAELAANPPPPPTPPIDKDDLIARLSYDLTRANERIAVLEKSRLKARPRAPTDAEILRAMRVFAIDGMQQVHPRDDEDKKADH